uniref:Peptidase S1 domain-containing protein n=1 Tax=Timema shepardi TaxID=629360 RepID=A0A7R9B5S5_TIMSH|nr:unnamed protein product [Timema shepardi]
MEVSTSFTVRPEEFRSRKVKVKESDGSYYLFSVTDSIIRRNMRTSLLCGALLVAFAQVGCETCRPINDCIYLLLLQAAVLPDCQLKPVDQSMIVSISCCYRQRYFQTASSGTSRLPVETCRPINDCIYLLLLQAAVLPDCQLKPVDQSMIVSISCCYRQRYFQTASSGTSRLPVETCRPINDCIYLLLLQAAVLPDCQLKPVDQSMIVSISCCYRQRYFQTASSGTSRLPVETCRPINDCIYLLLLQAAVLPDCQLKPVDQSMIVSISCCYRQRYFQTASSGTSRLPVETCRPINDCIYLLLLQAAVLPDCQLKPVDQSMIVSISCCYRQRYFQTASSGTSRLPVETCRPINDCIYLLLLQAAVLPDCQLKPVDQSMIVSISCCYRQRYFQTASSGTSRLPVETCRPINDCIYLLLLQAAVLPDCQLKPVDQSMIVSISCCYRQRYFQTASSGTSRLPVETCRPINDCIYLLLLQAAVLPDCQLKPVDQSMIVSISCCYRQRYFQTASSGTSRLPVETCRPINDCIYLLLLQAAVLPDCQLKPVDQSMIVSISCCYRQRYFQTASSGTSRLPVETCRPINDCIYLLLLQAAVLPDCQLKPVDQSMIVSISCCYRQRYFQTASSGTSRLPVETCRPINDCIYLLLLQAAVLPDCQLKPVDQSMIVSISCCYRQRYFQTASSGTSRLPVETCRPINDCIYLLLLQAAVLPDCQLKPVDQSMIVSISCCYRQRYFQTASSGTSRLPVETCRPINDCIYLLLLQAAVLPDCQLKPVDQSMIVSISCCYRQRYFQTASSGTSRLPVETCRPINDCIYLLLLQAAVLPDCQLKPVDQSMIVSISCCYRQRYFQTASSGTSRLPVETCRPINDCIYLLLLQAAVLPDCQLKPVDQSMIVSISCCYRQRYFQTASSGTSRLPVETCRPINDCIYLLLLQTAVLHDWTQLKPVNLYVPEDTVVRSPQEWDEIYARQELRPLTPIEVVGAVPQPAEAGKTSVTHTPDPRIIGGASAARGQFPWQAYLILGGSGLCGGSIISSTWILTAAHCLQGFDTFSVTLGSTSRAVAQIGSHTQVSRLAIIHAQYSGIFIRNDIGLIRLNHDVEFSDVITPVRLPSWSQSANSFSGYPAIVSGFGLTVGVPFMRVASFGNTHSTPNPAPPYQVPVDTCGVVLFHEWLILSPTGGSTASATLNYADVAIISNTVCSTTFPLNLRDSNICTSSTNGKSPCNGDSGGPLVILETDGLYTEVGIVSFGTRDCPVGSPAAFVRVTSFLDWISINTGLSIPTLVPTYLSAISPPSELCHSLAYTCDSQRAHIRGITTLVSAYTCDSQRARIRGITTLVSAYTCDSQRADIRGITVLVLVQRADGNAGVGGQPLEVGRHSDKGSRCVGRAVGASERHDTDLSKCTISLLDHQGTTAVSLYQREENMTLLLGTYVARTPSTGAQGADVGGQDAGSKGVGADSVGDDTDVSKEQQSGLLTGGSDGRVQTNDGNVVSDGVWVVAGVDDGGTDGLGHGSGLGSGSAGRTQDEPLMTITLELQLQPTWHTCSGLPLSTMSSGKDPLVGDQGSSAKSTSSQDDKCLPRDLTSSGRRSTDDTTLGKSHRDFAR